MAGKSSTRSKTHAYLNISNWIAPTGKCVFWLDDMHNPELYERTIADEVKREKSLTVFESNIQKHKSI